jgi:mannose-1-phosphate guanylyltransferase / phosphomannomutase
LKAVVMAGGEGSRLRPLTINRPKPMIPLADRPVMEQIIEHLKQHGITEIVVTLQYLANIIQDYFGDGSAFGVHIDYVVEETPLGTAGSVKNAESLLQEPFLVISGDALTDINLRAVQRFHQEKNALCTITLTRVPDPLEYGVIITDDQQHVTHFLEKPSWGQVFSDTVNTGIYVLDPRIFAYMEKGKPADWSKDVLPSMLACGEAIYGFVADGYWTDVGSFTEYMRATGDYLAGRVDIPRLGRPIRDQIWSNGDVDIAPDAKLSGPIFLGHGVKIKSGAVIRGPTVIRAYTVIDAGATVDRSIIWRHSYVGERAEMHGTLIARQCNIKSRAMLLEGSVIGDQTVVNSGAVIQPDVKIWPSKQIDEGATITESLIWGSQGRRTLFGRDGISGLVNVDITPEFCAKLGAAYGGTLPRGATVLVNRDAHYSPRMLKRGIMSGLPSAGINAGDIRTLPIPVARYLIHAAGAIGGIHVRLSPFDNRVVDIKFFDEQGIDIDTNTKRKIESSFFREDYRRVYLNEIGRISYPANAEQIYIPNFLKALRPEALDAIAEDFNIVIDYANTDASGILPAIFRRLQCDVVELNSNFDETRLIQSTEEFEENMDQLAAIVPVLKAELGARLDSGGERLYLVDNRGHRLTGLQLLAVATELSMRSHCGGVVAVPVSAPRAFEKIAQRHGGTIVRTQETQAALMQYATQHRDYLLLGDTNGNLIFPSFYPTVDGLFAIVKLMELLALLNVKLGDVVEELPGYHMAQTRIACRWENKGKVMRILNEEFAERHVEQIDGVKIDMGQEWVLVLPDPDGPFFHVIAEGIDDQHARLLTSKYGEIITSLQ